MRDETFGEIAERNWRAMTAVPEWMPTMAAIAVAAVALIGLGVSTARAVRQGGSFAEWLMGAVGFLVASLQVISALPLLLICVLLPAATVYEFLIDRFEAPRIERIRSGQWEWWAATMPSAVVGIAGLAVVIGLYALVWSIPGIGPVARYWFDHSVSQE